MFENRYDEALEEVSTANGLNWNDDSKVRLLARFLLEGQLLQDPHQFQRFEEWLEQQAQAELGAENYCDECGELMDECTCDETGEEDEQSE